MSVSIIFLLCSSDLVSNRMVFYVTIVSVTLVFVLEFLFCFYFSNKKVINSFSRAYADTQMELFLSYTYKHMMSPVVQY